MALDPVTALLDIGSKVIDKIWPDPIERDKAKLELLRLQQSGELAVIVGQMEINKVEAASTSLFVAGWRPWAGWVGGMGLAYASIIEPLARFFSVVVYGYTGSFPIVDTTVSFQILVGMLGLGGLRTYEKLKDVASK